MAPLEAAPTAHAARLRVLVVDDNVDVADALCAVLDTLGCDTAVAYNGTQGLAQAAAFHPQLVVIDLEMPDLGGCEVARQLRASGGLGAARLVCLTGHGQADDRRVCLDAGFDHFFTKPLRPASLAALVASATSTAHGPAPTRPRAGF